MKKILSTILMSIFMISLAFSQAAKTDSGKKFPTFVKFNYDVRSDQKNDVFQEFLQLNEYDQLQLLSSEQDAIGYTHDKHQQFYGGVKVEGSTVTIHSKNGKISSMSGNYRSVKEMNVIPVIFPTDAFDLAIAHVGAERYAWDEYGFLGKKGFERPEAELVIMADQESLTTPKLAYKLEIHATYPLYNSNVYVDAITGVILKEESKIHTADAIGTGATRYSGSQTIHTDSNSGSFRMRDYSRGNGVLTWDGTTATSANSTTGVPNGASEYTDNDNNWTAAEYDNADKDNAALDAHFAAAATYDFFSSAFGRNSYDNSGAAINSYVNVDIEAVFNYPSGYNDNAFWTGYVMVYGKGATYNPLTTVDITGHEIGHAFCEHTANLVYSNQSGAMNESHSDIWGACVENYTNINHGTTKDLWNLGTEIGTTFRSMSNPNAHSQPDTYLGTYWYTGTADNGGVHTNSGVGNHWFYILTVGQSGTNDNGDSYNVSSIGIDKAAAITWRSESVYLTTSSQYTNWRTYAIQSAEDLYGADSPEVIATTNAWYAVGVGAAYTAPIGCVGTTVDLTITFDNYPEETSWTIKNSGGTTVESGGTYGSQADGSTLNLSVTLAAGDYTFTINDTYGDGICCSYGNGSYTLSSESTTIATGGSFGSSEATTFCVDAGGADTQAPTNPTNLTASNTTQTTTDLSWTASSDNVGVTGYDVLVGGSVIGTVTGTSANITGLTAGTTYTMGVRAKDAAGNTSGTTSINVTTLSAGDTQAPTAPTNLTASNTAQTSTDLTWTASTDNVGVTGYDVYVDGSLNGSTASTSYAVTGLTAATTYSMSVRAKDAAGNQSSATAINVTTLSGGGGGSTVLFAHYFESGWDGWADGGSDCARYSGSRSYEGNYSIRIRDNSGTKSAMTSSSYDVSAYSQLEIEFYFYAYSMENGEDFWVRYYDGSSWNTVAAYARGTSFPNNNSFYTATVTISSSNYNFPSNAQFRFQCDASGNNDQIYIDQVTVTASNPTGFLANGGETKVSIDELGKGIENGLDIDTEDETVDGEVILYPNPATDKLSIAFEENVKSIKIFAISGRQIQEVKMQDEIQTIDISQLSPGIYFLTIETEDDVIVKRFIKQ